jgi:hypothetical protein
MSFLKTVLILLGTLSLCIGIIGIVVPGLPTTPFLLLTALLYTKSSDRLYTKLIANRLVGPYILRYNQNRGMTIKSKVYAITTMWVMISLSCILFVEPTNTRMTITAFGIIGTIVMGYVVPTVKK